VLKSLDEKPLETIMLSYFKDNAKPVATFRICGLLVGIFQMPFLPFGDKAYT
jgi:hypothetical protein